MIAKIKTHLSTSFKLLVLTLATLSIGVVVLLSASKTSADAGAETITLPLPDPIFVEYVESVSIKIAEENWTKHQITIKLNDSLSVVLERLGIGSQVSHSILQTENSKLITNLRVGDNIKIWLNEAGELQRIVYPKTQVIHHKLSVEDGSFIIQKQERPVEIRVVSAYGAIKGSFYLSGIRAGLNSKTIMDLADIFTWEIDFIRQLRIGDRFEVIYEQKFINGNYIGNGDILAARITTGKDRLHTAFLLRDKENQKIGYFDINKKNLRKAFLRNPVDFTRISSGFNPRRFHPVLKKYRAHRGIDYAAPTGTPIRAAGDGKISRRYYDRGWGNVIFIQHANNIVTVYGHMSKFGKYRKGQRVQQGAIIGYVGSTGLSTGPHLHYEFRINGVHVDPLTVEFASAEPVPKKHLTEFKRLAGLMNSHMGRLRPETQLAGNFE